jgi:hypothetical protein
VIPGGVGASMRVAAFPFSPYRYRQLARHFQNLLLSRPKFLTPSYELFGFPNEFLKFLHVLIHKPPQIWCHIVAKGMPYMLTSPLGVFSEGRGGALLCFGVFS